MIILSSFVGIFAVEEPTMTVSSGSAVAGQTVELDVVLSGNTGISFAHLNPNMIKACLNLSMSSTILKSFRAKRGLTVHTLDGNLQRKTIWKTACF